MDQDSSSRFLTSLDELMVKFHRCMHIFICIDILDGLFCDKKKTDFVSYNL